MTIFAFERISKPNSEHEIGQLTRKIEEAIKNNNFDESDLTKDLEIINKLLVKEKKEKLANDDFLFMVLKKIKNEGQLNNESWEEKLNKIVIKKTAEDIFERYNKKENIFDLFGEYGAKLIKEGFKFGKEIEKEVYCLIAVEAAQDIFNDYKTGKNIYDLFEEHRTKLKEQGLNLSQLGREIEKEVERLIMADNKKK